MKYPILLLLTATICLFSACGTPGQAYVKQHPDLPKEHKQILLTGKIPDGDAVAGMSREEIQLVMGPDVTQYTKVDGHDAWVYVKRKLGSESLTMTTSDFSHNDSRNRDSSNDGASHSPDAQPQVKTTIIFDGNIATHAEVTNGGL